MEWPTQRLNNGNLTYHLKLRFRYFGQFQCGIAVFIRFLCGFRTPLTPPSLSDLARNESDKRTELDRERYCLQIQQVCRKMKSKRHRFVRSNNDK